MGEPVQVAVRSPYPDNRRRIESILRTWPDRFQVVGLRPTGSVDQRASYGAQVIVYDASEIEEEHTDYPLRRLMADHCAAVVAVTPAAALELSAKVLRVGAVAAVALTDDAEEICRAVERAALAPREGQ